MLRFIVGRRTATTVSGAPALNRVVVACDTGSSSTFLRNEQRRNVFGRDREMAETMLEDRYYQESFEALHRFKQSSTYPGAIRAATPGDTDNYFGSIQTVYNPKERHYWRPVTDDPQVTPWVSVRVRFKESVNEGVRWVTKMHVVRVRVQQNITVQQLIDEVRSANDSIYIAQKPFTLSIGGKQLGFEETLESILSTVNAGSKRGRYDLTVDGIEDDDHMLHTPGMLPKNYDRDEFGHDELQQSPYAEFEDPGHRWGHARPVGVLSKYGAGSQRHQELATQDFRIHRTFR